MKFSELLEMIEEEIYLELRNRIEQTGNLDELLRIDEMIEERKRAGYGKRYKTKDSTTPSYYSAGTVPNIHRRKMTDDHKKERERIGKILLGAMRRGKKDKIAQKLQRNIRGRAKKVLGKTPTRAEELSFMWALATDMVLKGQSNWRDVIKNTGQKRKKP